MPDEHTQRPEPATQSPGQTREVNGGALPDARNTSAANEASAIDDPAHEIASGAIPLVGIGASAGGLEALVNLFDAMPGDTGLAFLIVLHLDPTRESQVSAILAHHTAMPVLEIEDGMQVAANHVYVIAPNRYLTLRGNELQLIEPSQPRGHRHPVDVLFTALAEQRRERTVAIILSGTGTNGTQGLKEIKAAGGLILIQDPDTARFDGMPQSAIKAGLADHVLAPAAMPQTLLGFLRHGYIATPDVVATTADEQSALTQLVGLLRLHGGHNFQNYKPTMLLRRIHRRMGVRSVDGLESYIGLLRTDGGEIRALAKDLLISVSSFFRDEEAWTILDQTVIAPLIADREAGATIRVWVPACATGEEAYSLAMLLVERAEAAGKEFELKILASDILDDNLRVAREGVYPGSAVEMLLRGRVERFFEKRDSYYRVRKDLRDLVVFARQDVLRDPPFSRMDVITCRNLLIYIKPEVQRRTIAIFHFGLCEGGHLFLGNAETIGLADDLFETVSKKWRIYRRIGPTRHDIVELPTMGAAPTQHHPTLSSVVPEQATRATELARRVLLDRYAPASVLIDQKGRILYFHGDTGDYLQQPTGEPTRDLLAMAREGLLTKLRAAIQSVSVEKRAVTFTAEVRQGDVFRPVSITFSPLPGSRQAASLILVTFEPEPPGPASTLRELPPVEAPTSSALEEELRTTRAELHSTIEQLESANEEMTAANEEATSINEELQSTNEELETSKEELQSFNEELYTVNNQLQHKIQELEDTSNDLANLLAGTEMATVFLDSEMRLKWFSPTTRQLLDLLDSDIGRPISHFARKFADDNLLRDAQMVLSQLTRIDAEIRSDEGKWFLRRILPYRTRDNRIAGLVVSFTDITESRRAADAINEARIYAEGIVATARQPLVVLDADLRVRSANQAFYNLFNRSRERTEERPLYELSEGEWNSPELRRLLDEVLPKDKQVQDVAIAFGPRGAGQRTMLINARKLTRNGEREDLILLSVEEITERHRAAAHQEMLVSELSHRVKNVLATVQAIVSQTISQSASMDEFKIAFEGRLSALAHAHNLLVEEKWAGTAIRPLVVETLAPYRRQDAALTTVQGPDLTVPPQIGVALVMILHELATNAAKYGALSVPTGHLQVSWERSDSAVGPVIRIEWCETGGPTVTLPTRQGFGTKLIKRSAVYELGGEARLEYLPEGLRCELIFPPGGLDPPEPPEVS